MYGGILGRRVALEFGGAWEGSAIFARGLLSAFARFPMADWWPVTGLRWDLWGGRDAEVVAVAGEMEEIRFQQLNKFLYNKPFIPWADAKIILSV